MDASPQIPHEEGKKEAGKLLGQAEAAAHLGDNFHPRMLAMDENKSLGKDFPKASKRLPNHPGSAQSTNKRKVHSSPAKERRLRWAAMKIEGCIVGNRPRLNCLEVCL
ncbi:hypothetical protein Bbelb_314780 [Branchiostoma belcheri]|nr:hypothetical protein Bbelb_314780 [Branchiostoma belcheri]